MTLLKRNRPADRASPGLAPKVLVISLPKSGTNVLSSTLEMFPGMTRRRRTGLNSRLRFWPLNLLPFHSERMCLVGVNRPQRIPLFAVRLALAQIRPWQFGMGHVPYQANFMTLLNQLGLHPIFVLRDPRDVLVSTIHFAAMRQSHFLANTMRALRTDRDRLRALILGGRTADGHRLTGVAEQLDLIAGWINDPHVLTVRFEQIIGGRGAGDTSRQVHTIMRLADFIGLPLDEDGARRIGSAMFGRGATFRKGAIGAWREVFDEELIQLFRDAVGDRLASFGYSW